MKKIHEFEIRMMKFDKYIYLITSVLFFIFSIIKKQGNLALVGIFFIQPILLLCIMNLLKDSKMFRKYFIQCSKRNGQVMNLMNEILALFIIIIVSIFLRNMNWYTIIISIIFGIVFTFLRNLIKIEQKIIIIEPK